MHWSSLFPLAALFLGEASAANERVYQDPDTKLSFYQTYQPYKLDGGKGITFRIAIPDDQSSTSYDTVVQLVVPNEIGWTGIAWGGAMPGNPLLVVFRNSNNQGVLASSRWANTYTAPSTYTGATYAVFKSGTKINGTHWQVTAKCTGCTSWRGMTGSNNFIKPKGDHRFGWVYSFQKPSNPSSASASIGIHDTPQYFSLELGKGVNKDFVTLVGKLT